MYKGGLISSHKKRKRLVTSCVPLGEQQIHRTLKIHPKGDLKPMRVKSVTFYNRLSATLRQQLKKKLPKISFQVFLEDLSANVGVILSLQVKFHAQSVRISIKFC